MYSENRQTPESKYPTDRLRFVSSTKQVTKASLFFFIDKPGAERMTARKTNVSSIILVEIGFREREEAERKTRRLNIYSTMNNIRCFPTMSGGYGYINSMCCVCPGAPSSCVALAAVRGQV